MKGPYFTFFVVAGFCAALLVQAPGVCHASRVELSLDTGPRAIQSWWSHLPSPVVTWGLGVKFEPPRYPCTVRGARVLVDSITELRIHIMDADGNDLCPAATVAALEPYSWAEAEFASGVRIDSGKFYVLGEMVMGNQQAIAVSKSASGGSTETQLWDSAGGFGCQHNGHAMIRATVDLPVKAEVADRSHAGNNHIFLLFDSEMEASTINSDNLTVLSPQPQCIPVNGTWSYDENLWRAEFVPDQPFARGFHRLEVSANAEDVYGNPCVELSRAFVSDSEVDDTAPGPPELIVRGDDRVIDVQWQAGMASDVVGYFVYAGGYNSGTTMDDWLSSAERTDVGEVFEVRIPVESNDVVWRVAVSAYDQSRNESQVAYEDCVPHRGSVLLVVEQSMPGATREQPVDDLEEALENCAFHYTLYDESQTGTLPSADYLSIFEAVFWERGIRFPMYGPVNASTILQQYMEAGGALYYDAMRSLDRYNPGDPFFSDWLHCEYRGENFDVACVEGAPDDPVGDGVELIYGALWTRDVGYFAPAGDAVGFLTIKDTDQTCGLRYEDTTGYGYRLVYSTAPIWPGFVTDQRDRLLSRGMCWVQGKDVDFRVGANTRVLAPYRMLELSVSVNTLGANLDADAYLAVLVQTEEGSEVLLFFDGADFMSEMRPFVSNVHLEAGFFLPRTKVFELLYRGGLPAGRYTFLVGLMQAGTSDLVTELDTATLVLIE